LRGELYVYVHAIISCKEKKLNEKIKCRFIEFLKDYLDFFLEYLKVLPAFYEEYIDAVK